MTDTDTMDVGGGGGSLVCKGNGCYNIFNDYFIVHGQRALEG